MFRTCFYSMNQTVNPLCSRSASQLPKKLPNAYSLFVSENYKLFKSKLPPNTLSKEVLRQLGETWSTMPMIKKAEYIKRHDEAANEYENFFKTAPLRLIYDVEDKKEQKLIMKKFVECGRLPKKPPASGYALFVSRQKRLPGQKSQDFIRSCAERFSHLTEDEKQLYKDEVGAMKQEYDALFAKLMNG